MTPEEVTEIVRKTLYIILEMSVPFLLVALLLGIAIAIVQTATHVHEMTLSFVPKMLGMAAALAFLFPWVLKMLVQFTHHLLIDQWCYVTQCMH